MQEEQKSKSPISREQVLLTGGTLLASGVAEVALHAGPGGLLAGAAATIVMAQFGPDIINAFVPSREATRQVVGVTSRVAEKVSPPSDVHTDQSTRAKLKRLISFQSPAHIKQDVFVQSEEAPDAPEEGDNAPTDIDTLFQVIQDKAESTITPRLRMNDIVRHTRLNSYQVCIGRSLIRRGNPPVWINWYGQHLKLIGASQYGKSSMAAAMLYLITRTHAPSHVLIALLDMEHKTSKLFADIPHLAEVFVNGREVTLHAKTREQALEYLRYIVAVMDERYTLSEEEVEQEPVLLVYLEEFLALKDYFKRLIDALQGEAKEQAKKNYAQLVFNVSEIARRGLKVKVQLLMCAQVDYRDDDFQEALVNITGGMSFCVRVSAALAAGFTRTDFLRRNVEEDAKGQAVVETPDCKDLVLAPEFDLKKKLLAFEKERQACNPRPVEPRTSMLAPANSRRREEEMPGIEDLQSVSDVNLRRSEPSSQTDLERALQAYDEGNRTINALALALEMSPWNVRPLYTQVKRLRENAG